MSTTERWFLTANERGNAWTNLDRRHEDGRPWTEGNQVVPLVHGAVYFGRLYEELSALSGGDVVWFFDWRGDADERLAGPGTEVGAVLAEAAKRGVDIRGLVWRSHPDQEKFSEQENVHLAALVNRAGGEVMLDERVRRFGSHHQKLVLIRRAGREGEDVGFVGGVDLCHGRRDDDRHQGDHQSIVIDRRYGPRPPWHDVQVEVRGPAVGDLEETFRERWTDPVPLDHRNPWRDRLRRLIRQPRRGSPLPEAMSDPPALGEMAVQVLRTYPAKAPPHPFAPRGERSVARGYAKAISRARSLIYLEDQYLWSREVASVLAAALRRAPELRLIAVLPRYPDRAGSVTGPLQRIGQEEALKAVFEAGLGHVAVYDVENEAGRPVYVHSKVCIIDDVWMSVGSDNLNRRSWTHDSELACAILDPRRDPREPLDPGGEGDGARVLPRNLRVQLWREHLGGTATEEELLDPKAGFEAWRRMAEALDEWHAAGRRGVRPPGRAREHRPEPVSPWVSWWARPVHRLAIDPDGRPRPLRRSGAF